MVWQKSSSLLHTNYFNCNNGVREIFFYHLRKKKRTSLKQSIYDINIKKNKNKEANKQKTEDKIALLSLVEKNQNW